jgi:hypothetical protein
MLINFIIKILYGTWIYFVKSGSTFAETVTYITEV